jgi:hypothetical protein
MNNEILDAIKKPRNLRKEQMAYRFLVGFLWLVQGGVLLYQGLYKLHQYSESLRGRGLLVLYDPTPSLFDCFEPITLGLLSIPLGLSIIRTSKLRPKLILLYLSIYTFFFIQGYYLQEALLPLIPFLIVIKFRLSFIESVLGLLSSWGLIILVWMVQGKSFIKIIKILTIQDPSKVFLLILVALSLWKYSSDIKTLFKIKISFINKLFLFISATPWILAYLFHFLGLKQGGKFFF